MSGTRRTRSPFAPSRSRPWQPRSPEVSHATSGACLAACAMAPTGALLPVRKRSGALENCSQMPSRGSVGNAPATLQYPHQDSVLRVLDLQGPLYAMVCVGPICDPSRVFLRVRIASRIWSFRLGIQGWGFRIYSEVHGLDNPVVADNYNPVITRNPLVTHNRDP